LIRRQISRQNPNILAIAPVWDGKDLFSGTEVAHQFGGYLEGASEAADHTVSTLQATLKPR